MRDRGRRSWFSGHIRRRAVDDEDDPPPQRSLLSPEVEPAEQPDGLLTTFRPRPLECPHCRSTSLKVYGTSREGGVYYHRCQDCERRFKSIEQPRPR